MSKELFVTCPHCHRKNRMPADKLTAHVKKPCLQASQSH